MLVNVNELIKAVKQFPELYDSSHVDYYKHSLKEQKWMLIAKKFNLDIDKPKELWQRLRLIYRQALKNQERRRRNNNSTLNERRIKPWVYQEQMAFLQPFLKNRSKETEMDILMLSDNEEEEEEEEEKGGGGGRGRGGGQGRGTQDREEDVSNNPWEIPVVLVDKLPSTDTTAISLAHSCINLKIPYNFETQEPIMDAPEVKGDEEVSIDDLEIKIEPQEIEDVEEVSIDDLEIKIEHQEIEDVKDVEFGGEVVKIQGSQFVNPQFEIDIEVPEVSFSDNTFSSIPNTNQATYLEDDDDDDDEEMAIHGEGMSSHEEEFMDDGMQPQLDSRKKINQKNRSRKKAKYRKLSKYDALKELVNRGQFSSGLVGSVNYSKGMVDIVRQKVIDSISNEIGTVTKEKEIDGSDSMVSEDDISSRGLSELEKTQKQILEGKNENWVQEGENQKLVPKAENQRTVSVTKNQNWVPEDKNQKPELKNVKNNGCKKGRIQRQKVGVDSASTVGESGLCKFSNIKKSVEQTSVNASSVKNSVRENLEPELLQYEMVHEPSCDSSTFTIVSDSDETNGENVHTNLVPIQESVVDASSTVSNNDLAEGLLEFVTIPEKPVVEVVGNVTKKGKRRDKVQKCRVSRSRITKAYTPNPKKSKYEALKEQIFNGNQELKSEEDNTLRKFFDSMYNLTKAMPKHFQGKIRRKMFESIMEAEEEIHSNPRKCYENLNNYY